MDYNYTINHEYILSVNDVNKEKLEISLSNSMVSMRT